MQVGTVYLLLVPNYIKQQIDYSNLLI